jgi:hypothetical protein
VEIDFIKGLSASNHDPVIAEEKTSKGHYKGDRQDVDRTGRGIFALDLKAAGFHSNFITHGV